ncbi:isoquinoline 1-oxidoreductase alpha subunit [Alteromonadaceae bacterium 2753L.S.0a.02]|nr:isoquinoline 1-oxidoreductase alpha subunit [Alteromonadaceae bacterium 2753L.S.0a.02]
MIKLTVNDQALELDADPNMPLLYALRDLAGLTGTKFGCGLGQCGACTVLINGNPTRSCLTPLSAVVGSKITTIEGLASEDELHPVQQAWLDNKVPQCGYCQSGQIMSAVALLASNPSPSDKDIDNYMQGNICRCGTYPRIKQAIKDAGVQIQEVKRG